jgi:hypothetical protein
MVLKTLGVFYFQTYFLELSLNSATYKLLNSYIHLWQAVRLTRVYLRSNPFSALGVPNSDDFDHLGPWTICAIHHR